MLVLSAESSAKCEFVLGFKTLRDLIGHEIVADCLENEDHIVLAGSVWQTTTGLTAWS